MASPPQNFFPHPDQHLSALNVGWVSDVEFLPPRGLLPTLVKIQGLDEHPRPEDANPPDKALSWKIIGSLTHIPSHLDTGVNYL